MSDQFSHLSPQTRKVFDACVVVWPEHARFMGKSADRLTPRVAALIEEIATQVLVLAAGSGEPLAELCSDYRFWAQELVLPEEIYFRRENRYRLSTFADANAEVYSNAPLMKRYMNAALMVQVLSANHAEAMDHYVNVFLAGARPGGRHLEVGPGHGLQLYLAERYGKVGSLAAWDVSDTSIAKTKRNLALLGVKLPCDIAKADVTSGGKPFSPSAAFDTIVLSEVLEHLEHPHAALKTLFNWTAPGGRLWVNVPINSPLPDHLYLLRSPDEAAEAVAAAGYRIVDVGAFPMTGSTLEKAHKLALPVNVGIVGERPE